MQEEAAEAVDGLLTLVDVSDQVKSEKTAISRLQ
jgi:hypothetical protein